MKSILLMLALCLSCIANATNYYFSSITGDDTRTAAQAQNPATPWKSIAKLNSYFSSLVPGDSVLFKKGETFYGSITISKSGTSGRTMNIGAYGAGSNPVLTGLVSVTSFTSIGANLWESTGTVSTLATLKMVVINAVNTPMGRYPNISSTLTYPPKHLVPGNNGWLNYESYTGADQIVDNQLTASPNWTGAEAVVKKGNWVVDHGKITSHAGTRITYTPTMPADDGLNDMSYFIQNDIRTLDEQNEWYYNPTTKKITIYSSSMPTNVQVGNVQNLINRNDKDYITISNLDLKGSNDDMIFLKGNTAGNTTGWVITNCNLSLAGRDGIYCHDSGTGVTITNNTLTDCNNNGAFFGVYSSNIIINNNVLNNIGINPGMTDQHVDKGNTSCTGLSANCDYPPYNLTIRFNRLSNIGYNGIGFGGTNVLVSNNFIENFLSVKTDGGAIYTWNSDGAGANSNRVVEDNIIVNGSDLGVIGTQLEEQELSVNGIYLDGGSDNVIIRRNYISTVNAAGIYMNTPLNCTIRDNTIYNCRYASIHSNKDNGAPALNLVVKNNICVARSLNTAPTNSNQRCFYYLSWADDIATNVIADSNYYARPIDDATANPISKIVFAGSYTSWGEPGTQVKYTLAGWKTAFPTLDQHSKKSALSITDVNYLRFEYNETSSSKTITLGANYMDVKGVAYPGTITLAPYTAAVLIKNDVVNIPPVADAGGDQSIPLPVTVILRGKGTDPDGTIAAYLWTKVSGPTAVVITGSTLATATVTGMATGVYKFELKVTDNKGAIGRDTVTVNFATIIVPVTLVDFTGIAKPNKTTLLQWKTATEINSDYFVIERSTDGRNFTQIAIVNSTGNSNSIVNYQLTDAFPEAGINYYRLKMVDNDRQFQYSNIISVNFRESITGTVVIVSTVTGHNHFEVNINSGKTQAASYALYDATGKMIYTSSMLLQNGTNNIAKNIMLPNAVYYFKLLTSDEKMTVPLLNRN